jgi:hypothetical protein
MRYKILVLLPTFACSQAGLVPAEGGTAVDPSTTGRPPDAEAVPGGDPRWMKVDASGSVACGLLSNGIATCWGTGLWGQLDVPDARFVDLISGDFFSCGQTEEGEILCWGCENREGQDEEPTAPCDEAPSERLTGLEAGYNQACGITAEGDLLCWGMLSPFEEQTRWSGPFLGWGIGDANLCTIDPEGSTTCYGSLGTKPGRDEPIVALQPPAGSLFQQVATTPNGACGVGFDGIASCWGFDSRVPPGRGPAVPAPPIPLQTISSGGWDICGLGVDGRAVCWGDWFMDPEAPGYGPPPEDVQFESVEDGDLNACGVVLGGEEIRCWGTPGPTLDVPSIEDVMRAHADAP